MTELCLPEKFLARMREQLGTKETFDAFLNSYNIPVRKGIRVNPLKITREEFVKISPFSLQSVPWEENGFYVGENEKPGGHAYHFAGLYYVQEPSAMSVAPLVEARPGERILDLCAAPGGKSAQLAGQMRGEGILVCNEINGDRARILSQNIERLGVENAVVLTASPESLAARFRGYFDKILVDAPCSGEGMFKKNSREALENWSEANVAACAARQKNILDSAVKMLKKGGRLVYSTCTFAPAEDEEQIGRFLAEYPSFTLLAQKKLYPHETGGEGHYYAVLQSGGGETFSPREKTAVSNLSAKERAIFDDFCRRTLCGFFPSGRVLYRAGEMLYALPEGVFCLEKLPVLRAGIRLGTFEKGRFTPAHALAMCLKRENVLRTVNLSVAESEVYLRGETLSTEVENGWCLVCADNFPLGWGKAVNGTVKNHYPKGLRMQNLRG